MAWLSVGPLLFDAELVVFDKDGTLIDFEYAWGRQTVAAVERLVAAVKGENRLRDDLYRSLGYDPQTHRTAGTGPLATASIENCVPLLPSCSISMALFGMKPRHTPEIHSKPG